PEATVVRHAGDGSGTDEQPSRDRPLSHTDLVGVAHESGEPSPMSYIEFGFDALNPGAADGNGETDPSIEQRIIIGIVAEAPSKHAGVQAQLTSEGPGQPDFVIIRACRTYGQMQNLAADLTRFRGARDQEVFHSWGLKDPVVRGVKKKAGGAH